MALSALPARSRLRRTTSTAAVVAVSIAVGLAGLGAVPAHSEQDASCPAAFPVRKLVRHQPVTGLTVTEGTSPETFSGEVIGVLDDGIAPGLDMIMMDLTSPAIDEVGGIWQGMSGSPVYARDGRLIGAVAYGLSSGPSPIAGVTPARQMLALLDTAPTDPAAARTLQQAGESTAVDVPPTLARTMVASGDASSSEVAGGFRQLPTPLAVSGLATVRRLGGVAKTLGLANVRVYSAGSASAGGEQIPVVPGGNLAASLSYGDLSTIGTGTATAVCGDEVLAFGHPMLFSGPSAMTLHGADALYVQPDPVSAPFKVANPGAPMGAITGDRMAGLHGVLGETVIPGTTEVTSYVEAEGRSRFGRTRVSVPGMVPDLATMHLVVDQDRVFDGIGGGSGWVRWKVEGLREDGTPFAYTRRDHYASRDDVTGSPAFALNHQLSRLSHLDSESIRFTRIRTRSTLSRAYQRYRIGAVEVREWGMWRRLTRDGLLLVRPGTTRRFRVTLTSPQLGDRRVVTSLNVPARAGNQPGFLQVTGGATAAFDPGAAFAFAGSGELDVLLGSGGSAPSLDGLLTQIKTAPHNDEVSVRLVFLQRFGGMLSRQRRVRNDAVVTGARRFQVQSISLR